MAKSFSKTELFLLQCALSHPNGLVTIRAGEVSTRLGKRFGSRRVNAGINLRNAGFFKVIDIRKELINGHYFNFTIYRLTRRAA